MSSTPPLPPPMHPRWISSRGPCAGCKHLRRKCLPDCIFAPYFPASDTVKFSAVHRVFGASNAAKILLGVPVHLRQVAANSLVFEATARCKDVVFGTCQLITELNLQIQQLEHCIHDLKQKIRRQELLILQMLRQRDGFPNQQQHMQQQHLPRPPQIQTAMPYVSQPQVTVAVAPADVRTPTLQPGFRQQLEQNNSSGYHFTERINNSSGHLPPSGPHPATARQQLERNNNSGYVNDKVAGKQLLLPPATVSRQQLERNNSSGYHFAGRKNNSSGHLPPSGPHPATARQQLERNNSSGYVSDKVAGKQLVLPPATVSGQQLEQNNSSGYHFAKRINNTSGYLIDKPQPGPHPATARQQLERNNSSGSVSDRVAAKQLLLPPATVLRQQLEQNNSSGYHFAKRINNSSGYLIDKPQSGPHPATARQQLERNNSSGSVSDRVAAKQLLLPPVTVSRQQLEQNNGSEYFDKEVITQSSPHPATVQEPSSRQQVERTNDLEYLVDNVNATFPESSSGQQLERKQLERKNS